MTTTQLDTLNSKAAAYRVAIENTDRAVATHQRATEALQRARDAYTQAERDQTAAIERSLQDESVIVPRLDRSALDLAERKFEASERALNAARATEVALPEDLKEAETALHIALALDRARELFKQASALKALPILCALQGSDKVREALTSAGFYIARDINGRVTITLPKPDDIPKSVEAACLSAVSPRSAPAAMKYLQEQTPEKRTEAEQARSARRREIEHAERDALHEADAWFHALNRAEQYNRKAEYEARCSKVKAEANAARIAARV